MKEKRKNPYQMLLDDIQKFCFKIKHPKIVGMWVYPKEKLNKEWTLKDLYERVKAAEQLGYDVILISNEEGLVVRYREKNPIIPYRWE